MMNKLSKKEVDEIMQKDMAEFHICDCEECKRLRREDEMRQGRI
jgi:hypothetical protein